MRSNGGLGKGAKVARGKPDESEGDYSDSYYTASEYSNGPKKKTFGGAKGGKAAESESYYTEDYDSESQWSRSQSGGGYSGVENKLTQKAKEKK